MDMKEVWLQQFTKFFDKKFGSLAGSGINSMSNQQLA